MSGNFSYLMSPSRLGPLRLKNRIIMPALHIGMARSGEIEDRALDFYEIRARGGAAMIIVGICNTQPDFHNQSFDLSEDRFIPMMQELTRRIHAHDCLCVAQLAPITYYGAPKRRVPSLEQIPDVVENMVRAASRAKDAGFDGVEFLAAGGSLLSYFLSSVYNPGLSGYSGDLTKRMRLALEVITATRANVGPDFPLFIRIHGHEFLPGGYGLKEALVIAKTLAQAGVTAIDVTAGGFGTKIPQITTQVPPGTFAFLAREIKRTVDVPVMSGNRICDPVTAEHVLRWTGVDFVCFGRALVADPELPVKVKTGREDEIIPCIACCRCLDRTLMQQSLICTVNPWVGREGEILQPANPIRQVTVAGGGPAGLQAALVLRKRGHKVILHEAKNELGGAGRLASRSPGKEDMHRFMAALYTQVERLGAEIRLQSPIVPEQLKDIIKQEGTEAMIVATGGMPRQLEIPIEKDVRIYQAIEVLSGQAQVGQKVVILGGGGVACETALFVARMGALNADQASFLLTWGCLPTQEVLDLSRTSLEVKIITRAPALARSIGRSLRWVVKRELESLGVGCMTDSTCKAITAQGVLVSRNDQTQMLQADTVILASGFEPCHDLDKAARAIPMEVYVVGNASQSGNLLQTIHQATAAALRV